MRASSRLAIALGLVVAGSAAFAATRVQPAPRITPNPAQVSAFGLPKPSGLTAPFPAGISEGSGAARSTDPVASRGAPLPVDTAVNGNAVSNTSGGMTGLNNGFNNGFDNGVATETGGVATTVLGAGAGIGVPGPSQNALSGAAGYSATDVARFFFYADANHDGELTRAEYNRLPVKPLGFEQMDRNFDGVISRFEFDDAFR